MGINVRIYFEDGTRTLLWVPGDEAIETAILLLCEEEGWDVREVVEYAILETEEMSE